MREEDDAPLVDETVESVPIPSCDGTVLCGVLGTRPPQDLRGHLTPLLFPPLSYSPGPNHPTLCYFEVKNQLFIFGTRGLHPLPRIRPLPPWGLPFPCTFSGLFPQPDSRGRSDARIGNPCLDFVPAPQDPARLSTLNLSPLPAEVGEEPGDGVEEHGQRRSTGDVRQRGWRGTGSQRPRVAGLGWGAG